MPFLKGCGYNPKKDLVFLPMSGLYGANVRDRVDPAKCSWYQVRPCCCICCMLAEENKAWKRVCHSSAPARC